MFQLNYAAGKKVVEKFITRLSRTVFMAVSRPLFTRVMFSFSLPTFFFFGFETFLETRRASLINFHPFSTTLLGIVTPHDVHIIN